MAHVEPRSPRFHTAADVFGCVKVGHSCQVTNGAGNEGFPLTLTSQSPVNSRFFLKQSEILKNNQRLQSSFIFHSAHKWIHLRFARAGPSDPWSEPRSMIPLINLI